MYSYIKLRSAEFLQKTHLSEHPEKLGQQQPCLCLPCYTLVLHIPIWVRVHNARDTSSTFIFQKQYGPTQPSSLFILLERCCTNHETVKGASVDVCTWLSEQTGWTGNPPALSFSISFQRLPFCFYKGQTVLRRVWWQGPSESYKHQGGNFSTNGWKMSII